MKKNKVKIIGIIVLILIILFVGVLIIMNIKARSQQSQIIHSGNIEIVCNDDNGQQYAAITIQKGDKFAGVSTGLIKFTVTPQYAIWIEDMEGNYLETLYLTEKITKINRKSALPVYMGVLSREGLSADSVSSASATADKENMNKAQSSVNEKVFKIYMEVNNSFDYNDVYKENQAKGEKGYNTDYCGQPAVIYSAQVDLNEEKNYTLEPIGHSDPTGESSAIVPELEFIDGALQIIENVSIVFK